MNDIRIGVDIGGTFTDFALFDGRTGELEVDKRPTVTEDPSAGVIEGIKDMLARRKLTMKMVGEVIHATTVATNTVLERSGGSTALITTEGFRDVLIIGRQKRWDLFDNDALRSTPLIPRRHVFEVRERILADGSILTELDEETVLAAARAIAAEGLTSVAVCLIHSYANPAHERRIERILKTEFPQLLVSISSMVSPLYREYERANTTVMNAYVRPSVDRYVARLDSKLADMGFEQRMLIMQSNGGLATADIVRQFPIRIIESGPAAGVLTSVHFALAAGTDNLISFDMGGTTAKLCLIEHGKPALTSQFEVDMVGLRKASGLPISITAIDLIEIGSGGGSIAQVVNGALVVGPKSAGSTPGPVCYGRGGQLPTVTDADLVLGYLDDKHFLGGKMRLDREGAINAILKHVGEPLGIDAVSAAWGIHEVVTSQMAQAARAVTISRGRDPRSFALVPFGGAGPVHGVRLARMLGCQKLVFVRAAGVMSAVGLLMAEPAFDLARTQFVEIAAVNIETIGKIFAELEEQGRQQLAQSGMQGEFHLARSCDMQFVGQGYQITVELPQGKIDTKSLDAFRAAFLAGYRATYGDRTFDPAAVVAGVHWRLRASAGSDGILKVDDIAKSVHNAEAGMLKGKRPVWFPEAGGFIECRVYDRYSVGPGSVIEGPAIIEERESTIVLTPKSSATVDADYNILVELH
ncbi:MAG: hydantoinase/oxoprolinase family protein [Hyphomicrobiales bacterium]